MPPSTRIQIERLTALADYLMTVSPNRFDYSTFWRRDLGANECGTIGCALGHAGQLPMFQRLGLKTTDSQLQYRGKEIGRVADDCIMDLFGESADYLFYPTSRRDANNHPISKDVKPPKGGWSAASPAQVAKRIRFFVKELTESI